MVIDLSEKETIEKVKSKQSWMSKIQDSLLLGKGTREDLKEFDMQLREDYHKELSDLRKRWEEIYLELSSYQEVAQAIKETRGQVAVAKPLVVRLVGINEEEGKRILARAGIEAVDSMEEAAKQAVEIAEEQDGKWE